MKSSLSILLAVSLFALCACNKTKKYAKRLAGETWRITSVSLGQVAQDANKSATLVFEDCDIYVDTCIGQWQLDSGIADFVWQVNDNGKTFILSCLTSYEEIQGTEEGGKNYDALRQCQYLSGYYSIDKMKRKHMEISSNSTAGYPGVKVELTLERAD